MNFHQLKVFDAVARLHSFSKAAAELDLSQPTVSVHLQKLQEDLDIELVEQLGKSIHLTPAGELLFNYSQRIFSLIHEAVTEIEQLKGLQKGRLTIGASTTPGNYMLPGILAQFKNQYPEVELHFEVANSAKIAQKVAANELDYGIVGSNYTPSTNLLFTPLWNDELVAILAPQNPLATKGQLEISDLLGQNLILREQGSGTRRVFEEALAKAGKALKPTMEFSSTDGVKQAVIANLGISVVSKASVSYEQQAGILVLKSVQGLRLTRNFSLIRHKDKRPSPTDTAFLGHLQTL